MRVNTRDINSTRATTSDKPQELCESRGGRPGLPSLISLTVSVDVKQHSANNLSDNASELVLPFLTQRASRDPPLREPALTIVHAAVGWLQQLFTPHDLERVQSFPQALPAASPQPSKVMWRYESTRKGIN